MKKYLLPLLFIGGCITNGSAQTYNEWVEKSFKALADKDTVKAEICLKSALKTEPANPQNSLILSNLGTIQRMLGHREDALASYSNGLLFAPNSVAIFMNRAALYLEMDSLQSALNDYSRAITLDSKEVEALEMRGKIYMEKADTAAARKDFEQILKIEPNNREGKKGVALICKLQGNFQEAEKLYNSLIKNNIKDPKLFLNRAELYFFTKKYDKALSDITKSIDQDSSNPAAYFLRGKINWGLYERIDAKKDFLKAKELGYDAKQVENWLHKIK